MRIVGIVQARMSSSRCPGKVLRQVGDRPLLQYLLERLRRCQGLDDLVLATSVAESDDPLAAFATRAGVACHRGDLANVAGRFAAVLAAHPCDGFVRINGDSPLLDPALVDHAVALFRAGGCDLVTNVHPRSFPTGQSVEVVDSDRFRAAVREMTEPEDVEHVTRFCYRHAARFRITNFASGNAWSELRLAVDTREDLARFARLVANMSRPHWDYSCADLVTLLAGVAPAAAAEAAP
jgi:spore coat polysaccharide biosynthesis protein SpsF